MNYGYVLAWGFGIGLIIAMSLIIIFSMKESNSLSLVGDYTVSNYTSENGVFKIFLFSKEKLNYTILTNDNDITDKIMVAKIPY